MNRVTRTSLQAKFMTVLLGPWHSTPPPDRVATATAHALASCQPAVQRSTKSSCTCVVGSQCAVLQTLQTSCGLACSCIRHRVGFRAWMRLNSSKQAQAPAFQGQLVRGRFCGQCWCAGQCRGLGQTTEEAAHDLVVQACASVQPSPCPAEQLKRQPRPSEQLNTITGTARALPRSFAR